MVFIVDVVSFEYKEQSGESRLTTRAGADDL